ncbi:unnamed protein product [Hydatigera taeniaeformis]|uniref:Uncharacterized protein n=1 Tax=Hydatigena taeniaeformis TaxID=6205 RepID=A0A3P7ETQ0_HYDTA|nr:unnamed protein product [Hydatigera taeniaeformis]
MLSLCTNTYQLVCPDAEAGFIAPGGVLHPSTKAHSIHENGIQLNIHSKLDFSKDYVEPPVVPKDDLIYLQKELEEHLNKSEDTPFTSEGNQIILDDRNGEGVAKAPEGFSQSTSGEQNYSPTPSIEGDFLPPAPTVKSELPPQGALQEDAEFGEHFYPDTALHEDFDVPEFDSNHFHEAEAEVDEENDEHFNNQEPFNVQKHYEASEQFDEQEYFDDHEHFEGQELHEQPEHSNIQDHFEDQEQHEGLAHFENQQFLENQEHFENMEMDGSQERLENHYHWENQDHYNSQEYNEEEREPEVQSELPPQNSPTPELLHASEQVEHTDHLLENPEGFIEPPTNIDLLDAAHMDLVGGVDQFAVEKQESTPFHSAAGIGAGEAVINDFEQAASLALNEHPVESNRHMADALGVVVTEQPEAPQLPPIIQTEELLPQEAKPSFHDIKTNLEKRKYVH